MVETDDSPEARLAAARRLMATLPIFDQILNQAYASATTMPEAQRARFQVAWQVRRGMIEEIILAGYARFMTVRELDAAARFYASSEGRAIREKTPQHLAYVLQQIQPLVNAANAEALRDEK